ncbi:hypothetical protein DFH07DRAFT_693341, partial [Mycena maculata]
SEVDPLKRFCEAFAWCAANRAKPVALMGDVNARTKQESPASSKLQRVSSDDMPKDARGTWLLETCEDSLLEILNGTSIEGDAPGAFTSFQPNGRAVVDYALFSREFIDMLPPKALQIIPVPGEWSDHAIIALFIPLPPPSVHLPRVFIPNTPRILASLQPPTPCDLLALETVAASQT